MGRAIDKCYNCILNIRVAYNETSVKHVHRYEKVVNGSDIVCFVVSACNLRRQWLEYVGHVNGTFCFTGATDVLQR